MLTDPFEWFASSTSAWKQRNLHSHKVAQEIRHPKKHRRALPFLFQLYRGGGGGAKTANQERQKCKGKKCNKKNWKKVQSQNSAIQNGSQIFQPHHLQGGKALQKMQKKVGSQQKMQNGRKPKKIVCLFSPRGGCRMLRLYFMQRWKLVCLHTLVVRSIHGMAYFSRRKRLAFDLQGCWSFHACFTSVNVHFQLFAHLDVGCFLLATPTNLEEKSKCRV